ncbi:hypothetical protein [Celeribacter sp.]|uniref:hypothetical protein n=1 Tax=Celeribacter sp. TaxID=1890673 RepID=UPI003A92FF5C
MAFLDRFHPAKHMLAILEQERAAILAMDFSEMSRIAPRKERALKNLSTAKLTRKDLDAIQKASARNQNLLSAASKGINAVRQRLDSARTAKSSFQTYDRKGRSTSLVRKPLTNR